MHNQDLLYNYSVLGIFGVIAVAVYADYGTNFHYSFGLAIIGTIIAFICAGFAMLKLKEEPKE